MIINFTGYLRDLFKEDMFRDMTNAAFERCADVITSLILKYGPALKRKWNLNEWIRNIQAESLWKDLAYKRYQRYFICMKNIKSVPV